ncbi:heparinase II/III family protein [Parafilimonas sp.]|uniref:heparinase II/III domain-containing protein n=1 Tax=Parafilimonas sp. TaxID=1969739 RepID=UPI0039E56751
MKIKIYKSIVIISVLHCFSAGNAQDIIKRNLLHKYSEEAIAASLLPQNKWRPFPQTAGEWQAILPDSLKVRLIAEGEKYLHKPFASISASLYLEFKRNGNRTDFENISFKKRDQLFALVLAESIEQKGRFMEDIMNGVWSTCEETFWGNPAHYYLQKAGIGLADAEDPTVDLFASETAELLALTDYFTGNELDTISPLLRRRIYYEVNRRIFSPLSKDSVAYHFLGPGEKDAPVNNWNPWVLGNWIFSMLLLEKDDAARAKQLTHAMYLLDNYINGLGDDGAVDEGPSYWFGGAGRLFDVLMMLKDVTQNKVNIFDAPVIKKLGGYIKRMHIAGNYFINIADASPTINADGLLIYRIGKALQDTSLSNFGAWAYHNIDDRDFLHQDFFKPRIIWNLMAIKACDAINPAAPAAKEFCFSHIQLMADVTSSNLYVSSHAGNNGESHNHNDVGDFIVYSEGNPVIIDVGFGTYNAKTFSKDRYDLWYLNSAHHNVPLINNHQQAAGRKYEARDVAYKTGIDKTALQMNIAAAYPEEAGVQKWLRTLLLNKNRNELLITDDYILAKRKGELSQAFMTVCPVDLSKTGKIIFEIPGHRPVQLEYSSKDWEIKKELMSTSQPDEARIKNNWSNRQIWRIVLSSTNNNTKGKFQYKITQL